MISGPSAHVPARALLAPAFSLLLLVGTGSVSAAVANPSDTPPRVESGQVFERLDPSRPPALGPEPAKVVVLVFSDFQCPVCRRCAVATRQIADEFPGEVRVEFWQNALAMHAHAENAGVASLAAHRQGKFWDYHDEVFENQRALDPTSLAGHAARLGLEMEQFRRDYDDPQLRARVQDESSLAARFGARSTPAFMINGKLHLGWGSWSSFRANVEREVLEARKLEESGTPLAQIAQARATVHFSDSDLFRTYDERVLTPPAKTSATAADARAQAKAEKKRKKKEEREQKKRKRLAAAPDPTVP